MIHVVSHEKDQKFHFQFSYTINSHYIRGHKPVIGKIYTALYVTKKGQIKKIYHRFDISSRTLKYHEHFVYRLWKNMFLLSLVIDKLLKKIFSYL